MAIPDFADFGAPEIAFGIGSSDAARTPSMPGHSPGDTMLCYIAADGNLPTLKTANGWQLGIDSDGIQASSAIAGQDSIVIYWKRAVSSSEAAPVINDPAIDSNTCCVCHINRYSSVRTAGNPFHKIITATITTPTATISTPFVTTSIPDCMIGAVAASAEDDSLFQSWSGSAGVSGASIDSGFDTSFGNDCSWAGGRGGAAGSGTYNLTSIFQTPTQQAQITFALASVAEETSSANLTISNFTVNATGVLEIQGAANLTLDAFTVDAEENPEPNNGASDLTPNAFTLTASGVLEIQGSSNLTIDSFTVTAQQGPDIAVGSSTVKQRINAAQPTSGTFTTDPISTDTGSILVLCLMRGVWNNAANPKEPTDSQGNTWIEVHDFAYADFPNSRAGIWYCVNNAGSASHAFSATFGNDAGSGGGDEVTISVVELKGVFALQTSSHIEQPTASNVSGVSIKPTLASICLSWIAGSGIVGFTHDFTPDSASASAGWIVNSGATATGNPSDDGYIQIALGVLVDSTGTKLGTPQNCVWHNPAADEGGQIFQQVFQAQLGQIGNSTLAIDSFTLTATGGLIPINGVANITIDEFTSAALGQLDIQGSANPTLDAFSLSATGEVAIQGSATLDIDPFTAQVSGILPIQGSAILTLDEFSIQASGALSIEGSSIITLDEFTLVANGTLSIQGQASLTMDAFTGDFSGVSEVSNLTGVAALVLGVFTINASGALALQGTANITLDTFSIIAHGLIDGSEPIQVPIFKKAKTIDLRPKIRRRP